MWPSIGFEEFASGESQKTAKEISVLKQLKKNAKDEHRFWVAVEKMGVICYDWKNDELFVDTPTGEGFVSSVNILLDRCEEGLFERTPLGVLQALNLLEVAVIVEKCGRYITAEYLKELSEEAGFDTFEVIK